MVLPDPGGPTPSMRFELLREGGEDHKLLTLAEDVIGRRATEQLVEYVDSFKSEYVGAYFDCSNMIKYGVSSADWMNRNFQRRVEVMFPVEDPALRSRILDEILGTQLSDNSRTRILRPTGTYDRVTAAPGEPVLLTGDTTSRSLEARMRALTSPLSATSRKRRERKAIASP